MLDDYRDLTEELSDYEKGTLVPFILRGLSNKVGSAMAVTNAVMCKAAKAHNIETSEPRIRKVIQYLRITGIIPHLLSGRRGYYIATTVEEYDVCIDSLLKRIAAQEMMVNQLIFQRKQFVKENENKNQH